MASSAQFEIVVRQRLVIDSISGQRGDSTSFHPTKIRDQLRRILEDPGSSEMCVEVTIRELCEKCRRGQ
ncbi:hypothetical protein A6X21_03395 [Planctopirus hydrillae]|uniref:Uncharacterized protein n=1 Tax=Planctopirus hydrillae TaxID=1841610 RepID=A0A1C3ENA3_9PLAN|nr:hypothetical protein A6X21_03395 [Planctopirus hydrillae]